MEQERLEKLSVTRKNKINEVLGNGDAFKDVAVESVIEKLVSVARGASSEFEPECEAYNLLATRKENLKLIDIQIESEFLEVNE